MNETTEQNALSIKTRSNQIYAIWFVGACFTLFQFFLQLSSGVVISTIMKDMHLSALMAGLLGSAFYYVYTTLQIPAGIFFDRYNPRVLITASAFVCALGCIFFAHSNTFYTLLFSRLLIGTGSAFAFIGLSHLLRLFFPLRYFSLLLGLSETVAFIVTALGISHLSQIIHGWGWRTFMLDVGLLGFFISLMAWFVLPGHMRILKNCQIPVSQNMTYDRLFSNPYLWLNGLFVFLGFITITVFGAMWAVPYIQTKLSCSLHQAAQIDAWLFLGAALSCPCAGFLSAQFKTHQPITMGSALITALFIIMILYTKTQNMIVYCVLMFMIGFFCGGYMLAFSICNHFVKHQQQTTATGFTNTMAMLSAPILIPIIGYAIDYFITQGYSGLTAYQIALTIIPFLLIIASCIAFYLPNKQ